MNIKPSQVELETAITVIEWLIENTKVNEPYATNFIDAGETFLEEIPTDIDEI